MPDISASILNSIPQDIQNLIPSMSQFGFASSSASQTIVDVAATSLTLGTKATQFLIAAGIAVGVIVGGWMVARWLMTRTHSALIRAKVGEMPAQFLASTVRFVVILTAFIIAIIQLGVPATSLVAILGALMLALGLGLKDTLTNVAAGIMLLVNRPFETGDFVQIGVHKGTVKRINLFQTELNTLDNIRIFVPNLIVWNDAVQNYTHNRVRMVEVFVGLDYRHTIAEGRAAIEAAVASESRILREPVPFIGVDAFGENSVNFIIRVWVKTSDWAPVRYSLLERIKVEIDRRKMTIPFPQRVVHMASPSPLPLQTALKRGKKKTTVRQPARKKRR